MKFYELYCEGKEKEVWDKLVSFGDKVYEKKLYSDAIDIAQEVVKRSKHNLINIHKKLQMLNYEFEIPNEVLVLVQDKDDINNKLDSFEDKYGRLPIIMRVWFENISSVNFNQSQNQLGFPKKDLDKDIACLGYFQRLMVRDISYCLCDNEQNKKRGESGNIHEVRNYDTFLPLGTYSSACEHEGFKLPCFALDAQFSDDGYTFVESLREAFMWGGFPFWKILISNPKQNILPYQPNFKKILPILKEGLKSI